MLTVEYWYTEDSFCRAQSALRRAIGQHASRNRWIYIGLTQQDPKERFRQHQSKWAPGYQWDKMIVIYRARSFSLMCHVEDQLIEYARQQVKQGRYACTLLNDKCSQQPLASGNLHGYWIYILVQQ
jgi:predicted GIY-YIG superfamily endonuclease